MPDLKLIARDIFRDALAAVDIPTAMSRKLTRHGASLTAGDTTLNLSDYDSFLAIAIGKAAVPMARGLAALLAPDIAPTGILVAPHDSLAEVPGFRAIGAGHPLPDDGSFTAARAILDLLESANARTLVFFLLSGGGSSLAELPLNSGVTLEDVRGLNRLLVHCGAPIDEINTVRKHVSAVKGGRLTATAPAATKLTIGVSDVPAGRESALASGPTLPDPTTVADACHVIERYDLLPKLPRVFRELFSKPAQIPETPKPDDPAFQHSHFFLLLSSRDLLEAAQRAAEQKGCIGVRDDSTDDWPIGEAADHLIARLERLRDANPGKRVAVIADGEVSSPVTGDGIGGRNSAFVLDCVAKIAGKKITVLSAGTDGKDGSSPAAGAVANGDTLARARAAGLDPDDFARRSDSYSFFHSLGDAIQTGPTGNNLRDLRILLAICQRPCL